MNVVTLRTTALMLFCYACQCFQVFIVCLLFEYQDYLQRLMCLSGKLVTRARECQLLNGLLAVGEMWLCV